MSVHSHIEQLELRHRNLDEELSALAKSPSATDREVREVKRRKLQLKDEIARLNSRTSH